MSDVRRRPIADFLIFARDSPNAALGFGLALIAVIGLVVFGLVRFAGGSSGSRASHSPSGAEIGAQPTPLGSSATNPGTNTKRGAHSTTTRPGAKGSTPAPTSPSRSPLPTNATGGPGPIPPGRGTLPPAPPPGPLPMNQQRWVVTPSVVRMKAGALARGFIIVTNLSNHAGIVTSPGCSSAPSPMAVRRSAIVPCSLRPIVVGPGLHHRFIWTWHATQTGRGGAPPLAPGNYSFKVGPVTVPVTVR